MIFVLLFIFGAVFGSFACCQAWRLHARAEGKKLGARSVCMSCGEKLKWFDNIPIFSWIFLRGKCRFCHAKIGVSEILAELSLGAVYALFGMMVYAKDPEFANINLLLATGLLLVSLIFYWILMIYDAKWGELPVFLMLVLIPLALLYQYLIQGNWVYIGVSAGLLSGLYYLLYFFSKEKLVGGGDFMLCISIGIFLGRFEFAIIELFLSNFAASIAAAPGALKKDKRQIPFGPFLILSMVLILIFSDYLLKFLVIY